MSATTSLAGSAALPSQRVPFFYDPKVRGIIAQLVLALLVAWLVWTAASNAAENLARAKIASGFGFLTTTSGFDIGQRLIEYTASSSYGRAFVIGLLNTLLVAAIGCVLATFLGFAIGIARLSSNWIVSKLATIYVEGVRNVPLLLQLLIWYNAVLKPLPEPRESLTFGAGFFLNNRGFYTPYPIFEPGSWLIGAGLIAGLLGALGFRFWAKKQQSVTGRQYPIGPVAAALIIGLPVLGYLIAGQPVSFETAQRTRFNLTGGLQVLPEFMALVIGLTTYTAAFIAENVRSGIMAVSKGQTEAANALGLRAGPTLKLVVVPQAMRVIIPPLTSQYLNLTKNSSLAVAIGYPDLVQVGGTILNQTGQAIEVIAMWMAVYLTISVVTALAMNWYNARKALVER